MPGSNSILARITRSCWFVTQTTQITTKPDQLLQAMDLLCAALCLSNSVVNEALSSPQRHGDTELRRANEQAGDGFSCGSVALGNLRINHRTNLQLQSKPTQCLTSDHTLVNFIRSVINPRPSLVSIPIRQDRSIG
jgi:hypothetical protein